MTQKINNNQLREIYFDHALETKTFRKREDQNSANGSKQSFFDANINYERLNEKEIKRFENFFDTFVDPTPQNYIFKKPETISKVALPFEDEHSQEEDWTLNSKEQLEVKEEKTITLGLSQLEKDLMEQEKLDNEGLLLTPVEDVKDDELLYLENLVHSSAMSPKTNSLSELFDEIVDNEKESVSNYESSVFDANVQLLFGETDDTSEPPTLVPPSPPVPPKTFEIPSPPEAIVPPTPPKLEEVPQAPIVNEMIEPQVELPPEIEEERSASSYVIEEVFEADVEAFIEENIEEFVPEKKKKKKSSKLSILDTILVLIILTIIVILVYSQRHLLPFELPF